MKNISFFKPVLLCFSLLGIMASCDDKEELPPLQPPTAVKAVVTDAPPGIKVSWNVAEGADYYSVYVAEGEASQTAVPFSEYAFCGTSGSASFTYTVVEEGMGYYFAVKSCRHEDGGESSFSSPAFCLYAEGVSGGGDDEGDSSSLLQPPSNVRAVQEGSSVTVSWSSVQGAAGYNVYRVKDVASTSSAQRIERGVLATSVADKPSSSGTYYYYVRTMDSNGDLSDYSAAARCSFTSGGSGDKEEEEGGDGQDEEGSIPSTPTGLRAVQEGETIVVSWNAVENAYCYRLHYRTPMEIETFTNVYAPSTSAVFDRNLKEGTYTFWVQALNADYEASGNSGKVSCTFRSGSGGGGDETPRKLETPSNLEAYSGGSFVQISFDEVPLAYQYELYRSTSASSGYRKITASGGTSGGKYILTDQNPLSGTSYYKVKAIALSYLGIEDSDLSSYVRVNR